MERISGVAAFAAAVSNTTICNIPNHDEGDGQSVIMKLKFTLVLIDKMLDPFITDITPKKTTTLTYREKQFQRT